MLVAASGRGHVWRPYAARQWEGICERADPVRSLWQGNLTMVAAARQLSGCALADLRVLLTVYYLPEHVPLYSKRRMDASLKAERAPPSQANHAPVPIAKAGLLHCSSAARLPGWPHERAAPAPAREENRATSVARRLARCALRSVGIAAFTPRELRVPRGCESIDRVGAADVNHCCRDDHPSATEPGCRCRCSTLARWRPGPRWPDLAGLQLCLHLWRRLRSAW
jgi:hypothetical protein